jgi:ubiquinone/menaquinone biosynthesis C-methylase UbiE
MSFYGDVILPRLCDLAMRNRRLVPYRRRVLEAAHGRVLELGVGSGLNLPFYPTATREILALEPSPRLTAWAKDAAARAAQPVRFIDASAESIPLESASIDTVVTTWTLCTIPGASAALAEARRVLAPGGQLLFVEHGGAPDQGVRRWQDRVTPAWRRIAGGCHLNRPIAALIEDAGFALERLETGYAPGPRIMAFMYEGSARRA